MAERVEVGSIVCFEDPRTRDSEGGVRLVPGIVLFQWPDGSLQLWALHFEGSNLVHSIPLDQVDVVFRPREFERRLSDLEATPKDKSKPQFYVMDDATRA